MAESSSRRFRRDWIVASPHRDSFRSFVNLDDPTDSELHALLQEAFSRPLAGANETGVHIDYRGYRVVSGQDGAQPGPEFYEKKRTYHRLVKVRLRISAGEKTTDREYSLVSLPWMTGQDTFVIGGNEIIPIAQLLPGLGVIFSQKKRHADVSRNEFVAEIRALRGTSLRLRCWLAGARKQSRPTTLDGVVELGMRGQWSLRRFFTALIKETKDKQESGDKLDQFYQYLEKFKKRDDDESPLAWDPQGDNSDKAKPWQLIFGSDLGEVGRQRIVEKLTPAFAALQLSPPTDRSLTGADFAAIGIYFLALATGKPFAASLDDSEHLAHQRVRLLGDFLAQAFWRGVREGQEILRKNEKNKKSTNESEQVMQNLEIFLGTIEEHLQGCFRLGPLFQILDDTNPLSALSQKRTITRSGPGGLSSRYPHLEQRDLHPSHYGRLCPCETPESEDIGLALHLALYGRITNGQIETPMKARADHTTVWLPPAQITKRPFCTEVELRAERQRVGKILTRCYDFSGEPQGVSESEIAYVDPAMLQLIDVVPEQQLGIAACLIPFLSHSDANRMLMGAKNLKQALALVNPQVPLVQTGMEEIVAQLSGEEHEANRDGKECSTAFVDGKLALGTNLLVAYMPWRGYNFADAIVASDRLVKEDVLTTEHTIEVTFTIPASERVVHQAEAPAHMDPIGIIKVSTKAKAGMVLLRTARLTALRHHLTSKEQESEVQKGNVYVEGTYTYEITPRDYTAQVGQEGNVVRVDCIRDSLNRVRRVIIRLARRCPLTIGDKLMGRHGNKGVVGKIVPAEQMPTLPDGTPVDLVLNPHGVISRMNLGQLYETHLGWVLRHRQKLPPHAQSQVPEVVAPFDTVSRTQLQSWLQQTGLDENGKARLRDGRDGPEFANPVVVGYQYIVKLNHRPEDKLAARETGPYAALTQQPVKGRKFHGGQRIGEMETWALLAHQANHLLNEFFTTKADDPQRRRQLQQTLAQAISEDSLQGLSSTLPVSLRTALTLLQTIGIIAEPPSPIAPRNEAKSDFRTALLHHSLTWRYLEERDIESWNQRTSVGLLAHLAHAAVRSTTPAALRTAIKQAVTAEVREAVTFERVRYVNLQCGCVGPFSEVTTTQADSSKTLICRKHQQNYSQNLQLSADRWRPCAGGLYDPAIFGVQPGAPDADKEWDGETRENATRAWREQFGYIRLACPIVNPLTQQVMTGLPVLPAIFRYRYADDIPGRNRPDRPGQTSLDGHYVWILRLNNDIRALASTNAEKAQTLEEFRTVVIALAEAQTQAITIRAKIQELEVKKRSLESKFTEIRKLAAAIDRLFRGQAGHDDTECLERLIKGKHGIFRRAVLGKRNDYSGRAVIVPDPTLALDECRLPYRMGVELLRPWLRNALREDWPQVRRLLGEPHTRQVRGETVGGRRTRDDTIEAILFAPEEPNHRTAVQAVIPTVLGQGEQRRMCVLNRAPSLHKFNVLAFAIKELWDEAVLAIPPLVCAGFNADFDGDTMAVHIPVTAAGQHEARTRLVPQANLLSPASGKLVLSLSEDIIAGLAYARPDEARAFKGKLSTHVRQEVEQAAAVANAAQQCMQEGFEAATRAGLSFGLFDVPVVDGRQEFLAATLAEKADTVSKFYNGKLHYATRQEVAGRWKNMVNNEMTARLEDAFGQSPMNTVALLSFTGARGNALTVTQLGGMRGLMRRGSGNTLEYPIESNFVEGLSPLEFFFSAYGSRASLVDKKIQVAPAGDLTRRLVYCASHVRITQEDCDSTAKKRSVLSCAAPNGLCQHCYGEELDTKALPPIGRPVGLLAATAIGERGTQLSLRAFHTGGVKGDNITEGLPHISALLENQIVTIPTSRWNQYRAAAVHRGSSLNSPDDGLTPDAVRFRLGAVVSTPEDALTIVLGEAYQNYKEEDLPERLFAIILRAMINWRDRSKFLVRGLTEAARENLGSLERVAFRDAIRMANTNVAQKKSTVVGGLIERLMVAALL